MKRFPVTILAALTVAVFADQLHAQTNEPVSTNTPVVTTTNAPAVAAPHTNAAIVPTKHVGKRTDLVMQRAKDALGRYDIAFIGDSITEGWERNGSNVWARFYSTRNCINLGVSGDRTEHVLWRFENGQLDGLKPKVAVLMIGTNNSNKNRDGTEQYSEADILEGVQAIVKQIRERLPETKLMVLGIFPRGKTFSPQRGKILQVNQALEKLADNKMIFYLDFGSQMIEADGSISTGMMRDALHPGERGYEVWAEAIEPKFKELL